MPPCRIVRQRGSPPNAHAMARVQQRAESGLVGGSLTSPAASAPALPAAQSTRWCCSCSSADGSLQADRSHHPSPAAPVTQMQVNEASARPDICASPAPGRSHITMQIPPSGFPSPFARPEFIGSTVGRNNLWRTFNCAIFWVAYPPCLDELVFSLSLGSLRPAAEDTVILLSVHIHRLLLHHLRRQRPALCLHVAVCRRAGSCSRNLPPALLCIKQKLHCFVAGQQAEDCRQWPHESCQEALTAFVLVD